MIPPRKHPHTEDNVDSWLMSYADMITLLMCFFIIFVSVSEPKKDKFSLITEGLANKFGSVDLSTPFEGAFRSMQGVVENYQAFRDIAISKTDQSIEMELAGGTFFKKDSAELAQEKLPLLAELIGALKQADFVQYHITIEGHTSDAPAKSGLYASNWELSSARAARMVRYLIEQGIKPNVLKASGLADTQPKVPNADLNGQPIPENRARNERLVIKFERVM